MATEVRVPRRPWRSIPRPQPAVPAPPSRGKQRSAENQLTQRRGRWRRGCASGDVGGPPLRLSKPKHNGAPHEAHNQPIEAPTLRSAAPGTHTPVAIGRHRSPQWHHRENGPSSKPIEAPTLRSAAPGTHTPVAIGRHRSPQWHHRENGPSPKQPSKPIEAPTLRSAAPGRTPPSPSAVIEAPSGTTAKTDRHRSSDASKRRSGTHTPSPSAVIEAPSRTTAKTDLHRSLLKPRRFEAPLPGRTPAAIGRHRSPNTRGT